MKLDVIIIAHAGLAEAFVEAAEMIAGPQPNLRAVNFREGDSMIQLGNKVADMIQNSDAECTVILTDLYGATPTNAALLAMSKCENATVVAGVNLISLLQALELSGEDLDSQAVLELIEKEGKSGVRIITLEDLYRTD
jgi:mannose/fructose-specific phosphotransferase system component IIA